MTIASLQSRLDESTSRCDGLQTEVIKITSKLKDQEIRNERLSAKLQQRYNIIQYMDACVSIQCSLQYMDVSIYYRPEADDVRALQQQLSSLHIVIEQSATEHEKQLYQISSERDRERGEKERLV